MKIYVIAFFCVFTVSISFSKPISYEEVAVTFFTKKILIDNRNPFYNTKIYFDGRVNSQITPLSHSIIQRFPQDSLLAKSYQKEIKENEEKEKLAAVTCGMAPKVTSFSIPFSRPLEYSKSNCPRKDHVYNLQVDQYKEVNGTYFVRLVLVKKGCEKEYFIYIIMDKNQQILDWFYE